MFKFALNFPNTRKSGFAIISIILSLFCINVHASLTSYTSNGEELVYSSVSNVTWTKNGNMLGNLFASQGFNNVVDAIITASPIIINMPNTFSPTGAYVLTAADFSSDGRTSWFGAMAFVKYINTKIYGGSNEWYLPTVANTLVGYNTNTNGNIKGDELVELFYNELNGSAYNVIPETSTFDNEQGDFYWSSSEYVPFPKDAWNFSTLTGWQDTYGNKLTMLYAWAVSPGLIKVSQVPEPKVSGMLLIGLCLVGVTLHRKR